jgi:hypothetical protein
MLQFGVAPQIFKSKIILPQTVKSAKSAKSAKNAKTYDPKP